MKKNTKILSSIVVGLGSLILIGVFHIPQITLTDQDNTIQTEENQCTQPFCDYIKAKEIIESIYSTHNIHGFGASEEITNMIAEKGGNATYGEITQEAAHTLISDLKLSADDTFYDLGSGVGKLCMQVALTTPAKAIGIELSPKRVEDAIKARTALEQEHHATLGNRLQFIEQNILDADLKENATVFMCATCYPEPLLEAIVEKLKKTPGTKRVLSTKSLPGLIPIKEYTLPMTWAAETHVEFYVIE